MYKTRIVNRRSGAIATIGRIVYRSCAVLGMFVIVLTVFPIDNWIAERLAGPWTEPPGDVLVVLGGAKFTDDIIGESSYLRAANALRAYRQDHFRQILILGGSQPGVPVSSMMKEFLVSNGVPAEQIIVETQSNSTYENALYGKPIIAQLHGNKVLMTSDYHMYRAIRVFRKQGLDLLSRPVNDVERRQVRLLWRVPLFGELTTEAVKIAYYRYRGWI